ncbi:MAG: J domain-containing protein, partial [Cytophagaceae bacterium]
AYIKLIRQYHPDLVAHLGPELQVVAERRTKEITAAYEVLRHQGHLG